MLWMGSQGLETLSSHPCINSRAYISQLMNLASSSYTKHGMKLNFEATCSLYADIRVQAWTWLLLNKIILVHKMENGNKAVFPAMKTFDMWFETCIPQTGEFSVIFSTRATHGGGQAPNPAQNPARRQAGAAALPTAEPLPLLWALWLLVPHPYIPCGSLVIELAINTFSWSVWKRA